MMQCGVVAFLNAMKRQGRRKAEHPAGENEMVLF
jgi:hypothetical protein